MQEGKGGRKGTSRRRGRQEGKWETGLPGVLEMPFPLGSSSGEYITHITSTGHPVVRPIFVWAGEGRDSPPRIWGKWTRPKEGLRRGARMTDILGPAKFA